MTEWKLFDAERPPDWLDAEYWTNTPNCNHLDNRVHEARLKAVAHEADKVCESEGYGRVVDLGAGDGGLLSLLRKELQYASYGYEIIEDSIRYAKDVRHVDVRKAHVTKDLFNLDLGQVVTCTEFLEHLEDPERFLWDLRKTGVHYVVASSPWEETGTDHQWNHAWAWDLKGYAGLFERANWEVVRQYPVEWSQVLVARVPA